MRRWLTLMLLVFIPLQLSWSAAAAYCHHENAGAARHFGHHPHEHVDKADPSSLKDAAAKAEAHKTHKADQPCDGDCAYCHLGSAAALIAEVLKPGTQQAALATLEVEPPVSTRAPDQHDRPNWRIA